MAGMDHQALADIADRLYALPLDEFIPSRAAAAKEAAAGKAGKELGAGVRALAKPSAAAWTVNMLVRSRPDVLEELEELGSRMREAQEKFDAVALRELGRERRAVLASAVDAAREVADDAGRPLSNTLATDVEATLRALTADEGAAAAVRTGRLLRTLSADGVQQVSLDGAVAVPEVLSVPPARVATPPRRAEKAEPTASKAGAGKAPKGSAPRLKAAEPEAVKAPAADPEPEEVEPENQPEVEAPAKSAKPRLVAVQPKERRASSSVLEKAKARAEEARQEAEEANRAAEDRELEAAELTEEVLHLTAEAKRLKEELRAVEERLDGARKQEATAGAEARQLRRAADKTNRSADLAHERVLRLGNARS